MKLLVFEYFSSCFQCFLSDRPMDSVQRVGVAFRPLSLRLSGPLRLLSPVFLRPEKAKQNHLGWIFRHFFSMAGYFCLPKTHKIKRLCW